MTGDPTVGGDPPVTGGPAETGDPAVTGGPAASGNPAVAGGPAVSGSPAETDGRVVTGRELDACERRLLGELLGHEFPGVGALREQASGVRGRPGCPCGCGTLELIVDEAVRAVSEADSPVPVSGEITGDDGTPAGGLLLFLENGRLGALEVFSYGDRPLAMPDPGRVTWIRDPDDGGRDH